MEDYKKETRALYEKYAREFEEKSKDYLQKYLINEANLFIKNLKGKDILDLGSGPGRDSLYFKEKGLNPLCIDISQHMVELCRERGLQAKIMDLEDLPFPNSSFDGIWAHTSLLHITKRRIDFVIDKIHQILKEDGVFFIGMKEGSSEGYEDNPDYPGNIRWNSLYKEEELEEKLKKYFRKIHNSRYVVSDARIYLNFLGIKNKI